MARERAAEDDPHLGSSPDSVPTSSSTASNGSARTISLRWAASTVPAPGTAPPRRPLERRTERAHDAALGVAVLARRLGLFDDLAAEQLVEAPVFGEREEVGERGGDARGAGHRSIVLARRAIGKCFAGVKGSPAGSASGRWRRGRGGAEAPERGAGIAAVRRLSYRAG